MGKSFTEFIKGMKKPYILILIVVSVVLLFFGAFLPDDKEDVVLPSDDLTALCRQIDGVGRCETLINRDEDGQVLAVAVVCDGAERISVREDIYELISSLYGVGYNRISVLKFSN